MLRWLFREIERSFFLKSLGMLVALKVLVSYLEIHWLDSTWVQACCVFLVGSVVIVFKSLKQLRQTSEG